MVLLKTYQLDIKNMTAPLTVTVYPSSFDKKLEIRKNTHNSIQIVTFDNEGNEIESKKE